MPSMSPESKAAWRFASRRTPKRWRALPTALLQTLPLRHVGRLGLRRLRAARSSLLIVPGRLLKRWPHAIHVPRIQSGVALRFPPHSKTLARAANSPVANTASPARATPWTAPAERSGDGALDCSRTVVETLASCHPCPQNPKRRGASLPAALQNAGARCQQPCCKHCLSGTWDALDCAVCVQRALRF